MPARKKKVNLKGNSVEQLRTRIKELEKENRRLKKFAFIPSGEPTVIVPDELKPLFNKAQQTVNEYFSRLQTNPSRADIHVGDQRYLLVRAEALSYDFIHTILKLYADRGKAEAWSIGQNILFDLAHSVGITDAHAFHGKMKLKDPVARLSAGPVHFAYSGWAKVEILPESKPSPDENYFMIYNHPFSFESESWITKKKKAPFNACIMNAGYSSGWCEASFGIPLTAVEVTCKARGDEKCTFIMAPPHKIQEHLSRYIIKQGKRKKTTEFHVPTYFERKKIEENMELARKKAIESDRAKTDFLTNMSHEIRTPLTTIMGYIDLMLQEKHNPTQGEYLHTIKESSNHLRQLISDILDLSKIEAGQVVLEKISLDISALLHSIKKDADALLSASGKNVSVQIHLSAKGPGRIVTDPTRVRQIIYNLLGNAIKFTDSGVIEIGTRYITGSETLVFYVRDSGIGIDKEHQKIVFKKFAQADATVTRKYGGSGLGLAISNRLAELMGGKLTVKSKKNQGSEFAFSLPVEGLLSENGSAETATKEPVRKQKITTVLLAEDNITNRNLTRLILEKKGYQVITANNGREAVQKFTSGKKPDLVLMDIQMPVLDGLSATALIRKWEQENNKKRTPVVALTAHALQEELRKSREAGCDAFLTKPIEISQLLNTIMKLLAENKKL